MESDDGLLMLGLIIMLVVSAMVILDGKKNGKRSVLYRYSPFNPDSELPTKLRVILLVLGAVVSLLFVLLKLMGK